MRIKLYMCGGESDRLFSEFSLGLATLKANCPGDISIVKNPKDLVDCDLIGLSSRAWGTQEAIDIATTSKIPAILGGQATLWPEITKYPFKHIVTGEGEIALTSIINGNSAQLIQGTPIADLDTLEFADRGKCGEQVPIITSRGCPHNCKFCSAHSFWGKPRYQSPERFMEEVYWLLAKYPSMTTLRIMDDLFIAAGGRFSRIHNLWMRAGLNKRLKLRCFVKSSRFSSELAAMMKEMGFFMVRFGLETASDTLLKAVGKHTTVEQHQRAIDTAIKAGLSVTASFIHGLPGETEEERQLTEKFIAKNKGKMRIEGNYQFRPFPGTAYYNGESPLDEDMRFRYLGR